MRRMRTIDRDELRQMLITVFRNLPRSQRPKEPELTAFAMVRQPPLSLVTVQIELGDDFGNLK